MHRTPGNNWKTARTVIVQPCSVTSPPIRKASSMIPRATCSTCSTSVGTLLPSYISHWKKKSSHRIRYRNNHYLCPHEQTDGHPKRNPFPPRLSGNPAGTHGRWRPLRQRGTHEDTSCRYDIGSASCRHGMQTALSETTKRKAVELTTFSSSHR